MDDSDSGSAIFFMAGNRLSDPLVSQSKVFAVITPTKLICRNVTPTAGSIFTLELNYKPALRNLPFAVTPLKPIDITRPQFHMQATPFVIWF
jgi:hypothetical protein